LRVKYPEEPEKVYLKYFFVDDEIIVSKKNRKKKR